MNFFILKHKMMHDEDNQLVYLDMKLQQQKHLTIMSLQYFLLLKAL